MKRIITALSIVICFGFSPTEPCQAQSKLEPVDFCDVCLGEGIVRDGYNKKICPKCKGKKFIPRDKTKKDDKNRLKPQKFPEPQKK